MPPLLQQPSDILAYQSRQAAQTLQPSPLLSNNAFNAPNAILVSCPATWHECTSASVCTDIACSQVCSLSSLQTRCKQQTRTFHGHRLDRKHGVGMLSLRVIQRPASRQHPLRLLGRQASIKGFHVPLEVDGRRDLAVGADRLGRDHCRPVGSANSRLSYIEVICQDGIACGGHSPQVLLQIQSSQHRKLTC